MISANAHGIPNQPGANINYGTYSGPRSITRIPHPVRDAEEAVDVHGIVGLLDLVSSKYLIVITRREEVALIRGNAVYAVRDVHLISLASKAEAEKGILAARKIVDKSADGNSGGGKAGVSASDETDVEAGDTDVEVSDDDDKDVETATEGEVKPPEAEALEAPKQGVLGKGAGVAKGVVMTPVNVGKFAGKWFRGGGKKANIDDGAIETTKDSSTSPYSKDKQRQTATGAVIDYAKEDASHKDDSVVQSDTSGKSKDHSQSVIESLTPRIVRGARLYFSSSGFFFSYEHDLSGTLMQRGERTSNMPMWKRFDPMFFWNRHLLSPLIDVGFDHLALPLMQGFVGQRAFTIEKTDADENDVVTEAVQDAEDVLAAQATPAPDVQEKDRTKSHEFLLTLISRRSIRRAGLRYRRRGIDDDGNVANFVETEQILSTSGWHVSDQASSLLQIRGSIPLFFNQSPHSFKPQPLPFGSEATNHTAFAKHFETLAARYGKTQIASLVDRGGTEVGIGELYGKHVHITNNDGGIRGVSLGFEWFDFHHQCKGMKFENVSILLDTLEPKLKDFGWIVKQNDRNTGIQSGVLRSNCMDCLDRTNVVQSAVAGWALEQQLADLGLSIDLKKDSKTQWFNTLWADNGDHISKQYAGTAALKGDFTRTRRRGWTGALSDMSLSLTRYYNNIFGDYFLQACIDYYLGKTGPEVFEEFETDMMSQDYALDMRRVRQNGIDTCSKIVLEDPAEAFKAGWTLSCPKEANSLKTLPFEECVLLLTDAGLYFCRFDWDTEKVGSFERIDLRDIEEIWRGAYITSTLGPTHLDQEKNVGFAIRYKTTGKGIMRRNTRSLRNEEDVSNENEGKAELEKQQQPEKDGTRLLAFKALPPKATAVRDEHVDVDKHSEIELVRHMCDDIHRLLVLSRKQGEEDTGEAPQVEEKDVISVTDARKSTGYVESIGYSLKKLVWS